LEKEKEITEDDLKRSEKDVQQLTDEFVTLMGARRETDVLLTEGFEADDAVGAFDWGGWSGTMGQVPTLFVDNYDTQLPNNQFIFIHLKFFTYGTKRRF